MSELNYFALFCDRLNNVICFDYFSTSRALDKYTIDVYTHYIRSTLNNQYVKNASHIKRFLEKLLKFTKNISGEFSSGGCLQLPTIYCMSFLSSLKNQDERLQLIDIEGSIFNLFFNSIFVEKVKGASILYTLGNFYAMSKSSEEQLIYETNGNNISDEKVTLRPYKKFKSGINIKGASS